MIFTSHWHCRYTGPYTVLGPISPRAHQINMNLDLRIWSSALTFVAFTWHQTIMINYAICVFRTVVGWWLCVCVCVFDGELWLNRFRTNFASKMSWHTVCASTLLYFNFWIIYESIYCNRFSLLSSSSSWSHASALVHTATSNIDQMGLGNCVVFVTKARECHMRLR